METGTIKFFNAAKGFGFIERTGGEGDIFVHINGLPAGRTGFPPGTRVSFEVMLDRDHRPKAMNVRELDPAA